MSRKWEGPNGEVESCHAMSRNAKKSENGMTHGLLGGKIVAALGETVWRVSSKRLDTYRKSDIQVTLGSSWMGMVVIGDSSGRPFRYP